MDNNKLINKKTKNDISKRENLKEKCPYFPCHDLDKEEFDCRTCYCPFYKICSKKQNEIFGGYLLNGKIWACEKCTYIHKKEVVEEIIKLRSNNIPYEEIYNILIDKINTKV